MCGMYVIFFLVLVCLFGELLIELGRCVYVYMFCLLIGLDICIVDY